MRSGEPDDRLIYEDGSHEGRQYNDLNWGWAECEGTLKIPEAE